MIRDVRTIVDILWGSLKARKSGASALETARNVDARLQSMQRRCPAPKVTQDEAPLFLLSAGWRSGSTLLQRMVMADSDVLIWGEPYARSRIVQSLVNQIRAFTDEWPRDRELMKKNKDDISDDWVANLSPDIPHFVRAHAEFFRRMFAEPAREMNWSSWGLKEVRLKTEDALYLQWLFPRAKFIFLYRNPFDAFASYAGSAWYLNWPSRPVLTPVAFGRVWRDMVEDFQRDYRRVDGILVKYEDLGEDSTLRKLEAFLGHPVVHPENLRRIRGKRGGSRQKLSRLEHLLIRRAVGPTLEKAGYTDVG